MFSSTTTNTTHPKSTILSIISYALKGPPLDFKPDVHVNARRLINPPSELRKAFDGRCEGLRKNLRADPVLHELLAEAQPQIFEAEETRRALMIDTQDNSDHMIEIKVAVACVRGRHRSTAVAEELAKLPVWPEHYDVRVYHRDVDTPHRYQKWHQQNLEREKRGEIVGIDDYGEDGNKAELRSAAWWEDFKQDLSNLNSRDRLKAGGSTDPHNPAHISYEHHQGLVDIRQQTVAHAHVLAEHGGLATSQTQNPQHIPSVRTGHAPESQVSTAQHPLTAKSETPVSVQQAHQHDPLGKSPEHLNTQVQSLQHTPLEIPTVPAEVQTQMPEKFERPAEIQQPPQHIPPEKSEVLLVSQPQALQPIPSEKPEIPAASQTQSLPPNSSEKHEQSAKPQAQADQQSASEKSEMPIVSAVSQTQTPSVSSAKHEEPAGPQAQALQQTVPEKSEKPAEISEATQHSASEKPVEARAQPDSQHVST